MNQERLAQIQPQETIVKLEKWSEDITVEADEMWSFVRINSVLRVAHSSFLVEIFSTSSSGVDSNNSGGAKSNNSTIDLT